MSESISPSTPGPSPPPPTSRSQSPPTIATSASSFQSSVPAVSQPASSLRDNAAADPRIAELRAMFPDFEESLLAEILQSVNWNQDRAVDLLLGMSDPNFKSESRPEEHSDTQTELDEQLARRLHMEDQERHSAWVAQQMQGPLPPQSHRHNASTRQHAQSPSQQLPNQEGGAMTEVQDQFTKIAETGKKTFGNLFSKVKAKIQEFESGRPAGSSPPPQTNWSQPQHNHQWQSQAQYPAYQPHAHRPSRSSSSSPPIQLHGPQQAAPQPAFYDPNPPPSLHSPSIAPSTPAIAQTAPKEVTGYDVTPTAQAALTTSSTSPTPKVLDPGKLGILPRRPVSLLRPQSPPDGGTPNTVESATPPPGNSAPAKTERPVAQTADYDDDNVLDYADNPFEGHRK